MTEQKTRHYRIRPLILTLGAVAVVALAGTWAVAQCGAGPGCGASVAPAVDTASVSPSPPATAAKKCPMCKDGKMCKGCLAHSRQAAHAKLSAQVSGALKDLSAAETAIKAGEKKTALAQLAKVRKVLEGLQARVKPAAGGGIVNTFCPMMGGKVNPKVATAYKNGKVGFCCAMCIPKWNKLSGAAKAKKLAAALARKK